LHTPPRPPPAKAQLDQFDYVVGDIKPGDSVEVPVGLTTKADYACGTSLIVSADLVSDNAPTVHEQYRLFPGTENIFIETFAQQDDFEVNADGRDRPAKGELVRDDVTLSCNMTPRTPESDNTPGTAGAYVTGVDTELDGDSSLWSPVIDLTDTADPELAFDFWFEGEDGDSLLVDLSEDDKTFVKGFEETQSAHGWGLQRIRIKDVFGHIPKQITARFVFAGNGHLEGGVDNVRVLDPQGQCRNLATFGCGCSSEGEAAPQSALVVATLLLGARLLRRRRPSLVGGGGPSIVGGGGPSLVGGGGPPRPPRTP
jgi:MYXO-CTERM domain-containing protein